jgi:hypothetical protein
VKVSRRRGALRLQFDEVEAVVLAALFDEVALALDSDVLADDDPVRQRLFPAAYQDDAEADAEYRDLTEAGLRADRADRARACAEQLRPGAADLTLAGEDGERWIQSLNDLRLALGTRLGITEDDPDPDPDDPNFQERSAYYWLTALQDSLVRALMR